MNEFSQQSIEAKSNNWIISKRCVNRRIEEEGWIGFGETKNVEYIESDS